MTTLAAFYQKIKDCLSFLLIGLFLLPFGLYGQIEKSAWQLKTTVDKSVNDTWIVQELPTQYVTATISTANFYEKLKKKKQEIVLPTPDGDFETFIIEPNKVVADEVAHLYTIKTFQGYKKDNPSVLLACDISSLGFHATVYAPENMYIIEPALTHKNKQHLIYYKKDLKAEKITCGVENKANTIVEEHKQSQKNSSPQKYTYRLALVAAVEFSQKFGGNPYDDANVLNALASGVNLMNPIYLRDVGIEFKLVSTKELVFSDPVNNPFDTEDQDGLIITCHKTCVNFLDDNGFDVGHLVVWDDLGGLASTGVVCNDETKGEGFSGVTTSINTLWIDYVCHEIGHQFNAEHTFSAKECGSSVNGVRYEPGEGSSIMAYAGVCGGEASFADGSDPFFHYASINEIEIYIADNGAFCPVIETTNNTGEPQADAKSDITIPKSTPFVLVGEAKDDNDSPSQLTYTWEQYDGSGGETSGPPNCQSEDSPLFRYQPPTTNVYRSFPKHAETLSGNNNTVTWEKLPCVERNMNFSFVVRDNNKERGRVSQDLTIVKVANTGPFEVLAPNGGESFQGGNKVTVKWSVNGTDAHCSSVDILLSTDNGNTYSVLANKTPNDGGEEVILTNTSTSNARILIQCDVAGGFLAASTFYDVSDRIFTIQASTLPDNDDDGFAADVDCNDNDPNINPQAPETCNGIDDNCNDLVDDADPNVVGQTTWYQDSDNDGFGNPQVTLRACTQPEGYVDNDRDCDDTNGNVNPNATEVCNGIDDNCDNLVDGEDTSVGGTITWYRDADNDNFGNPQITTQACSQPQGFVMNNTDCNDNDENINPNATEVCNGIDDNCNDFTDDADPSITGQTTWYRDADNDGFGNKEDSIQSCTQPQGYIRDNTDCNDNDENIHPQATEICNGKDDNCNGLTDDDDPNVIGKPTWFRDADNDSFGDPQITLQACNQPDGYVDNSRDCDDTNGNVNPNATEVCNGIDDNCDGLVDGEDTSVSGTITWYRDADNDNFGNPQITLQACNQPDGYVTDNTDCNDDDENINPNATEVCNGIDDNCNDLVDNNDPNVVGQTTWYRDVDGDDFGDPEDSVRTCGFPDGYVQNNQDCDDNNGAINPSEIEICNGIDDNCDGLVDDADPNVTGQTTWYRDADSDSFGDPQITLQACSQPDGYVADNTDCNDNDANINPNAPEVCNGIDDNCNDLVDGDDPNFTGEESTWYADTDNDSFGDANNTLQACSQPAGYVTNALDCDDTNANITLPTTWYADTDNDSFGDANNTLEACVQPDGYVADNTDCNDNDASINPQVPEICNGIDDNCNDLTDDADPNITDQTTWYQDSDNDNFGNPQITLQACTQPDGYVGDNTDCNDNDATINPQAAEICNGIDDNCNNLVDGDDPNFTGEESTWFADTDNDSFGDANNTLIACSQPAGYVTNALDCDDTNATITLPIIWYADTDNDSFGDASNTLEACVQPDGYVGDNTDCNDNDANINPQVSEICNGIDDNCNDLVDGDDPNFTGEESTWFADTDNDSFGDANNTLIACSQPEGYVTNALDCDDTNANITVATIWYADTDNDNFGDANNTLEACSQPNGYVADNTDCDDNDATINPQAAEICNGIDDNCNNLVDGDDPNFTGEESTWFADTDNDSFGDANNSLQACSQPEGYVTNALDCDDTNANITLPTIWYEDNDNDSFGDANNTLEACSQPNGYVADNTDCNDNDASINPQAAEICNGIDDNCNNLVDGDDPNFTGQESTWYADTDNDSFGDVNNTLIACSQPEGYVTNALDCDDTNANITLATTWYQDSDNDGFGNNEVTLQACTQPDGYVSNNTDCNDTNANIHPDATEICNGIDDNCNGLTDAADPNVVGQNTWYQDNDNDGFGNPDNSTIACNRPAGFVADNTDCNDNNASINPDAPEVCNGVDDNCNNLIDSDDPDFTGENATWYADTDDDGFGDANNTLEACVQPDGYVGNALDCDDTDSNITLPTFWYADTDNDGFGDADNNTVSCNQPPGFVDNDLDCNDNDGDINPNASEICNGIDDNCNNLIDDADPNVIGATTWYIDNDNDGFGDSNTSQTSCNQPMGFVANDLDCNDNDRNINPDAPEICNGIDDNCNNLIDAEDPDVVGGPIWHQDSDNDGFGDPNNTIASCSQPMGYVANDLDCDDTNANINPDAAEVCNGIDDNCNNLVDDADPDLTDGTTWYADNDSDGFGDESNSQISCNQPMGFVANALDCNDNDGNINPDAAEVCNGIDDNCNDLVDVEDPDLTDGTIWYADTDNDGFGDENTSQTSCSQPMGFVANALDCNDNNSNINPNGVEVCNGQDDNCDGLVDDEDPTLLGEPTWYADNDNDGFGDENNSINSCIQPDGFVDSAGDCNDNDAAINPEATEICNGIDDNCNNLVDNSDPDVVGLLTWYQDADSDEFGNPAVVLTACNQPDGFVDNDLDCDDTNPNINPNAIEIPDNDIDEDCDGEDIITGIILLEKTTINLYPNPLFDYLQVQTDKPIQVDLKVLDLTGKMVWMEKGTMLPTKIDFTSLPIGTYFLAITATATQEQSIEKVVKLK